MLVKFACEANFVGNFFFFITASISLLAIGLFRCLFLSDSVLEDCMFLETYTFSNFVQFFGIQLFIVFSYDPLYFCDSSCYLPCFISDFIYLCPLSFFFFS